MAKFNYRMQSILDLKVKLEDQERTAYWLAAMRLREEEEKLQALALRRAGYERVGREMRAGGTIDVKELEANRKAVEAMKVLIRAQMLEVRRAEKDVEAARRRLQEAMQERKIHEKLREHAFEAFVEELEKEESKAVDELVSYSYSTK